MGLNNSLCIPSKSSTPSNARMNCKRLPAAVNRSFIVDFLSEVILIKAMAPVHRIYEPVCALALLTDLTCRC